MGANAAKYTPGFDTAYKFSFVKRLALITGQTLSVGFPATTVDEEPVRAIRHIRLQDVSSSPMTAAADVTWDAMEVGSDAYALVAGGTTDFYAECQKVTIKNNSSASAIILVLIQG